MNNISIVSESMICSNCGACKVICPKDAISFITSPLGRMYASVNERCIDCKACLKVCPSLDKFNLHSIFEDRYVGKIEQVYTGRANDEQIYNNAQSGGLCTATLKYLFEKKIIDAAVLCKMSAGMPPKTQAIVIDSETDLYECQKSKYAPVDLLSILRGYYDKKSLAVVGLPCQIQGIISLQNMGRCKNISYKLGLICECVLGSTLQDVLLSYHSVKSNGIIEWKKKDFTYSGKYYPYRDAPIRIRFDNGDDVVLPNDYRFALKDMYTSPRCRVCYDKLNSFADIVFGDPWGMSGIDWQKGESLVITRTFKGESLIQDIIRANDITLKHASFNELLKGQNIDERRKSVSAYSVALNALRIKANSYLYQQKDVATIPAKYIIAAKKNIEEYISNEELSREDIIGKSRSIIKNYVRRRKLSRLFIVRAVKKAFRIINLMK